MADPTPDTPDGTLPKKGEIRITKSSFDGDGLSTFMDAQIVDTTVISQRIVINDFL